MTESVQKLFSIIVQATSKNALKKAVFSKPSDPSLLRVVLTVRKIGQGLKWQLELFHADNKVTHQNIDVSPFPSFPSFLEKFGQINVLTTVGDCELRITKSGNSALLGAPGLAKKLDQISVGDAPVLKNEKAKQHILSGKEPFLIYLGISDSTGRVHDRRQSKYRQINRFLEIIRDVEDHLPKEGTIKIADLCCGKSYLSFAVYHYFCNILNRSVEMVGVDLKRDVIDFCEETAKAIGFDHLHFYCADIQSFNPDFSPDLVLSLHACDTATDVVLNKAVAWKTPVILSTPCCQHELNHTINCPELSFITRHSMLRQKFCEAATDSLRLLKLEAFGYSVSAIELIDPEETPKNILLRGIKDPSFNPNSASSIQKLAEYNRIKRFLVQEKDS